MVVIGLLSTFFGIIVLLLCGCYWVVMIIFSFFCAFGFLCLIVVMFRRGFCAVVSWFLCGFSVVLVWLLCGSCLVVLGLLYSFCAVVVCLLCGF